MPILTLFSRLTRWMCITIVGLLAIIITLGAVAIHYNGLSEKKEVARLKARVANLLVTDGTTAITAQQPVTIPPTAFAGYSPHLFVVIDKSTTAANALAQAEVAKVLTTVTTNPTNIITLTVTEYPTITITISEITPTFALLPKSTSSTSTSSSSPISSETGKKTDSGNPSFCFATDREILTPCANTATATSTSAAKKIANPVVLIIQILRWIR